MKRARTAKPTGDAIGHTNLEPGDHRQIKVKLSKSPEAGDQLWIALYKDKDNDRSFDPSSGDKPVWQETQIPPEALITVR